MVFWTKAVERTKNILRSKAFFFFTVPFMREFTEYGTARQATDGKINRHLRLARWITKVTSTHSEYVTFIAFPLKQ